MPSELLRASKDWIRTRTCTPLTYRDSRSVGGCADDISLLALLYHFVTAAFGRQSKGLACALSLVVLIGFEAIVIVDNKTG